MDNWSDEAQLRNIDHVRHRDGSREAVWVLALICGGGFVLLFQSGLEGFPFYALGTLIATVGSVAAVLVKKWISRIEAREKASLEAEVHESQRRERGHQLAEFRARNAAPKDPRTMPGLKVIE